jgi:histidyl-tRNA synthetase
MISARLWKKLGMADNVTLQINSLGSPEARTHYRGVLVKYLTRHQDSLDEDSKRRLESNPLRILDSKNPAMQKLIEAAPKLMDYLDDESAEHFDRLKQMLDDAGLVYQVNPRLVRGLDYYSKTVFEWVTDKLGAQGTICAGGRFDGLVEQLGGHATPAIGFALGIERLVSLLEDKQLVDHTLPHVYFIMAGEQAESQGRVLAESLRDLYPTLRLLVNAGGGSFKSQIKRADKSGASLALILGDDEVHNKMISIKDLRGTVDQESLSQTELVGYLERKFNL